MPREIADAYLIAAAEAFPFASPAAFRECTLRLTRIREGIFNKPTQRLADDLETWLRLRAGGRSLDTLRHLCDFVWFDDCPVDRSLAAVLADLARRTLEAHGGIVTLRRDGELPDRLAHFRWLSLLLPPDLLISALDPDPLTDRVSLVTPQLAQILREAPVAETHLHLGASVSFGLLWTGLMRALAHGDAPGPQDLPREPEPPPFGSAGRFLAMLVVAGIGRCLLGAFLSRRERAGRPVSLHNFFKEDVGPIAARMGWPFGTDAAERELRLAVGILVKGSEVFSLPRLTMLYRHLIGQPPRSVGSPRMQVLESDPLASWLAPAEGRALPETRFTARAMDYLRGTGKGDDWFARVFWQYQRVRCLTYRHLVQEPGTAGLDWFTRHYNRISPLRRSLKAALFESALDLESSDLQLGALEVRMSPDNSWAEVRKTVRDIARQAARHAARAIGAAPEVGLVLHFLKERLFTHGPFRRLHADPRQIAHGIRFGVWGYDQLRRAMAIAAAIEQSPELLLVLRGLDLAATELAVPTWATIPVIYRLRKASDRAARRLARKHPSWRVAPLRFTCHAGEDYRRLGEGLRRVHEVIAFGGLVAGDRIGHGVCLGHDAARWARTAGEIHLPDEDRLDDLLWELDLYARGSLGSESDRYAYVRAQALELARAIYGDPESARVDVEVLIEARRLRHDPRVLRRLGFPFLQAAGPSSRRAERFLFRYLTDPDVFRRGQRLSAVRVTEGETRFFRAAQAFLQHELGRLEITVESNPSSNLLIGDLLSVEDHPSFRLQPLPGQVPPVGCSVLLSINADDPLTFATSLADEFAHLYGALLRCDVPAPSALAWLGERRDHGYRSRFTLQASASADILHAFAAYDRSRMTR